MHFLPALISCAICAEAANEALTHQNERHRSQRVEQLHALRSLAQQNLQAQHAGQPMMPAQQPVPEFAADHPTNLDMSAFDMLSFPQQASRMPQQGHAVASLQTTRAGDKPHAFDTMDPDFSEMLQPSPAQQGLTLDQAAARDSREQETLLHPRFDAATLTRSQRRETYSQQALPSQPASSAGFMYLPRDFF